MELDKDEKYWKKYREELTKEMKKASNVKKNSKNIYEMAKKIGIKPTARYFNIEPSSVRYHIKKFENKKI